jgi:hypothetical protein
MKKRRGISQRAHENHGEAALTAAPKYSSLGHDQLAAPVVRFAMPLLEEAHAHLEGSSAVSVVPDERATAAAVNAGTSHQEFIVKDRATCLDERLTPIPASSNTLLSNGDSAIEHSAMMVRGGLVPTRKTGDVCINNEYHLTLDPRLMSIKCDTEAQVTPVTIT